MPRPRSIKLPDGEVRLYGFSKERADELRFLLQLKAPIVKETDPLAPVAPEALDKSSEAVLTPYIASVEMKEKAVSLMKDGHRFKIVVIKFNLQNKSFEVDKVTDVGDNQFIAMNEYKKEIYKLGFV